MYKKESKPLMRGWLHAVAFIGSIPLNYWLISLVQNTDLAFGVTIYAFSLTAGFGVSAAYHCIFWSNRTQRLMRALDHAMIYLLIAGSYTPVSLAALDNAWKIYILAIVWLGALLGITLTIMSIEKTRIIRGILYITLGWVALTALVPLWHNLSVREFCLMIAGGIFYTIGAAFFAAHRPNPWPRVFGYHEIWHVFMTIGAACHWCLIFDIITSLNT